MPIQKNEVILENVRLSFANLFKARSMEAGKEPKFGFAVILHKERDAKKIVAVQAAMEAAVIEEWGPDKSKWPKNIKYILRDGSERADTEGYGDDVMFFGANSASKFNVVDQDPNVPLTAQDGRPYSGCYVNVYVRFWAQNDKAHPEWGKKVNAQPLCVQFYRHGDAFGAKQVNGADVFSKVNPEEAEKASGGSSDANSLI